MSYLIFNDVVSIYAPVPVVIGNTKYDTVVNYVYSNVVNDDDLNNALRNYPAPQRISNEFERLLGELVKSKIEGALVRALIRKYEIKPNFKMLFMDLDADAIEFEDDGDWYLGARRISTARTKSTYNSGLGLNLMGRALKSAFKFVEGDLELRNLFNVYLALKIIEQKSSSYGDFNEYKKLGSVQDIIGKYTFDTSPREDQIRGDQAYTINKNYDRVVRELAPDVANFGLMLTRDKKLERLLKAARYDYRVLYESVARKPIGVKDKNTFEDFMINDVFMRLEMEKDPTLTPDAFRDTMNNSVIVFDVLNLGRAKQLLEEMKAADASEREKLRAEFGKIAQTTANYKKEVIYSLYNRYKQGDPQIANRVSEYLNTHEIDIENMMSDHSDPNTLERRVSDILENVRRKALVIIRKDHPLSPYINDVFDVDGESFYTIRDYVYYEIARLFREDAASAFNLMRAQQNIDASLKQVKNTIMDARIRNNAQVALYAKFNMASPATEYDLSDARTLSLLDNEDLQEEADPYDCILGKCDLRTGQNYAGMVEAQLKQAIRPENFRVVFNEAAVKEVADKDRFVRAWIENRAVELTKTTDLFSKYLQNTLNVYTQDNNMGSSQPYVMTARDVEDLLFRLYQTDVRAVTDIPEALKFVTRALNVANPPEAALSVWRFVYSAFYNAGTSFNVASINELVYLLFESRFYTTYAVITREAQLDDVWEKVLYAVAFLLQVLMTFGVKSIDARGIELAFAVLQLDVGERRRANEINDELVLDVSDGAVGGHELHDGAITDDIRRLFTARGIVLSKPAVLTGLLGQRADELARLCYRDLRVRRRVAYYSMRTMV